MTGGGPQFSIGQVAQRTGLSVHTLRLYEREGLMLSRVQRTAGGRRVYSEDDVAWLSYCRRFRASGMPLATIRRYVELVREGPGNEGERLALLRRHQQVVADQIADLSECLDVITHKVGIYEEHVARGAATELWGATPAGDR